MSMASSDNTATLASFLLRLLVYVFLEWIPEPKLPAVILGLTVAYFIPFSFTPPRDGGRKASLKLAILIGAPHSNRFVNWFSRIVNLSLVAMTVDMMFHAPNAFPATDLVFSRVGYVSDQSASVLVRDPRPELQPLSLQFRFVGPVRWSEMLFFRSPEDRPWRSPISIPVLDDSTDFTATIVLDGLAPDSQYEYILSNNVTGGFITAPGPGQFSARPDRGNGSEFVFLHSSCMKARFPYRPNDHPLSIKGLKLLADWIPAVGAQFMLFLGDFIYIDVPMRFGNSVEHYRQEYRRVYSSPHWPNASSVTDKQTGKPVALPWLHVLDDHEIANDWDSNTTGVYGAAIDPFVNYHMNPNVASVRADLGSSIRKSKRPLTYSSFVQGPASFFMLDTRRYRSAESLPWDTPLEEKTMLGRRQRAALLTWLNQLEPTGVFWKIVVSSVPFTSNWQVGTGDTWGGYLSEREMLLEAMFDVTALNHYGVVILSGDRHEFAATRFRPTAEQRLEYPDRWPADIAVTEYSTGPLSMFSFPFRTYWQHKSEDEEIKYIPFGRSKFGIIRISSTGPTTAAAVDGGEWATTTRTAAEAESPKLAVEKPAGKTSFLHYDLVVDGKLQWQHTLNVSIPQVVESRYSRLLSQIVGIGRMAPSTEVGLVEYFGDDD